MKKEKIRIAVIDGQGGGIGKALMERFKQMHPDIHILALGTNAVATATMMKGGADEGATGENAICFNAEKMNIIAGPIGILMANGLLGELTPRMAETIGRSDAVKILIPSQQCKIRLATEKGQTIRQYLDEAACILDDEIAKFMQD